MLRTRRPALCFALLSYSFANNFAKVIPTHGAHVAQRHVGDVRAGKGRDLRRNAMINWSSCAASEHEPENWKPVFGKDHAQAKKSDFDPIQFDRIKV
jgi:hypothetical protein